MLDLFTILSKSGIVLWYFQGTGQLLTDSVNELIKNIILEERNVQTAWNHNTLSLQFKLDNEFELLFVVAYQNILKLTYVDKLLTEIQLRFRDKYKQVIQNGQFNHNFENFSSDFQQILKQCELEAEEQACQARRPRRYEESEKSTKTVASMIETKKGFLSNFVSSSSSANTTQTTTTTVSSSPSSKQIDSDSGNENQVEILSSFDDDAKKPAVRQMRKFDKSKINKNPSSPQQKNKSSKEPKKWQQDVDLNSLDYSSDKAVSNTNNSSSNLDEIAAYQYVSKKDVGKSMGDLKPIEVNDTGNDLFDDEEYDNLNKDKNTGKKQTKQTNGSAAKNTNGNSGGGLFSSLKSLVGSKVLTKEMIEPVMEKMQEHLVAKNVAAEIAKKVCDNVSQNLEGKQMGSFQFVTTIIRDALQQSMVQILTPKRRIDILRDVYEAQNQKRPYVIVFCGVNGVGKSTNLAKVTFWLIENSFRVLIAACDTFRSGAVEQLRTHTRHLNALHPPERHDGLQMVELYEKGYGKDAAAIAHHAISYAKDNKIDVVLVDTAGRMQDNEPLMKELAKLININNPDLVLFVGEALVGNEAVDQVKKFNQALIDNSPIKTTNPDQVRTIDGIVLTKFDTIDDKVGAALSMTYTTGQPIVFVGTGQTYSDLKSLNAQSVVKSLLK